MSAYEARHRKPRRSFAVRFWCVVLSVPTVLVLSACTPRRDVPPVGVGTATSAPAMPGATMLDHNIPSTAPGACHADCGVTP